MKVFLSSFLFLMSIVGFSQIKQDSVVMDNDQALILGELQSSDNFKNPFRAGLYSAILPGLGQAYNNKYWKVPFAWGLVGTGVGFTIFLNNRYHNYRDAYIAELNGETHKYSGIYNLNNLANIQDKAKRNRDYAIALSILAYMVNIIDATVDAHLDQVRKDKELSIRPSSILDPVSKDLNIGLTLNFKL